DSEVMNPLVPVKARIEKIQPEIVQVKTYTVALEGPFAASPGQCNMVGYPGVGEAPISLSSLVQKNRFEHTIKAVGRVTRYLDGLRVGDYLFLRGPFGNGWPMHKAENLDILLIAGGIGLAPLRPVVREILNNRETYGEVNLIYGARNEDGLLFTNEYEDWRRSISIHLTVDEALRPKKWRNHIGLVTDLFDKITINPENTGAFICGPEIMMRFVCRALAFRRLPPSKIHVSMERRMKCGIGHCGHCQHYGLFVCKDGPVFSYDQVRGLPDGLL
ncbi:MAG: FAD/NAD(P)-binding protein, partial [Nitrospirota bacterium]